MTGPSETGSTRGGPTEVPTELSSVMRALARAPGRAPTLAPGTVVGEHFRVEEILGRGGMGTVYRALDLQLGRAVALKLQHDQDPRTRERVLREARALARLSHRNVVSIYAAGTHGDAVFLAMELVEGEDVAAWLERCSPSPAQILAVYHEAARGLAATHAAGLVHRDFKPQNVLVGRDGRVKVADFGLARAPAPAEPGAAPLAPADPVFVDLTRTGAVVGTPAYMAPEQRMGLAGDARADQFSFGVALYESLYGARPEPDADVPRRQGVPRGVRRALGRMLRLDPEQRAATMDELLPALDPARRRRRLAAGLGVALVGTGLGMAVLGGRNPDPCQAPSRAALDLLPPEESAQAAAAALATWAEGWGRVRREVCLAAEHETRPPEVIEAREACLDLALRSFRTMVRIRGEQEDLDPTRVLGAVEALPMPTECLEPSLETLRPSANERPAVDRFLARLAEESVEANLVSVPPARRREELLGEARALGYDPATARALRLLGRWAIELGEWRLAQAYLEESFLLAMGARDDPSAAVAAADEAWALISSGDDLEGAELWTRLAEASARRLSDGNYVLNKVKGARARLLEAQGRYDEAVALDRELLGAVRADPARSRLNEMGLLLNLGASLDAAGHPEEALGIYEEGLEMVRQILGAQSSYAADAHTNLGLTLTALGRYDEATDHLRRALAIYGRVGARAKEVDARLNLGIALGAAGRLDRAQAELEAVRAAQIESLGPTHDDVALSEAALGWIHGKAGRHDEAARAYGRALEIHRARLGETHPQTLEVAGEYAAALRAAGREGESCATYRLLLEWARQAEGDAPAVDLSGCPDVNDGPGRGPDRRSEGKE